MKRKKTTIVLTLVLVLLAVGMGAFWFFARAHRISACLCHLNWIAKSIALSQEDRGSPPSELSELCAEGTVDMLPKACFVCPADAKDWNVIEASQTFYSSYYYSPDAAASGNSNAVMLHCRHHMKDLRCVNIAFGDGRTRDYYIKEAREWLPDL